MEAKTAREKQIRREGCIEGLEKGKQIGRNEIRDKLIELLGLDDRYMFDDD